MINLFGAGFDDKDPNWKRQSRTQTYAVALIVSGKLVYQADQVTLTLGKGDLLFLPPDSQIHAYHADQDYHQKYWATFTVTAPDDDLPPIVRDRVPFSFRTGQFEYMKKRFVQLTQQWIGKRPYFNQICSAIILELLGQINRELDTLHYPSPMLKLVTGVQDYVINHFREELRVDELAKLFDISPNYLSSVFSRLTGQTMKEYIHQVKLSAARDMILNNEINVGQAASYVGYCNQAYFNRVFKKLYGYPPSMLLKEKRLMNQYLERVKQTCSSG